MSQKIAVENPAITLSNVNGEKTLQIR